MDKEFQKEIAQMPLGSADLKALFEYLDRPNPPPCDHTLADTIAFLKSRGLEPAEIVPWLNRLWRLLRL